MEEEEQGVSFGRICYVAFHRWKLLLIIIAAVTLVGFFGVYFGYNYLFNVYNVEFSYYDSGLVSEVKADNTSFNYRSLISLETLVSVRDSKPEYAGINVESLSENEAFSIKREVDDDTKAISYTISIKRNKMPSKKVTKNFFMDLANYPIQEDKEYIATSTFDGPLKQMDTVETFREQINLLSTEASVIKGGYDSIRQLRLSNDVLDEITTNIIKIDALFDGDKVNTMQNTVIAYGLAPDYSKVNTGYLEEQKASLLYEKNQNNILIENLTAKIQELGTQAQITTLGQQMESLIVRNNAIDQEVDRIDKTLANTTSEVPPQQAQLVKDIKTIKDGLYDSIDDYKVVMNEAYVDKAKVVYANNNVVTTTKNMNLAYSVLLPLAVGLVAGIITNLIVDRKLLREEEVKQEPAK